MDTAIAAHPELNVAIVARRKSLDKWLDDQN